MSRLQKDIWSGNELPGGIVGYPLDRIYEEVAYVSYYFHWPLQEVLNLEHAERRRWVEEIAKINQKLTEMAYKV